MRGILGDVFKQQTQGLVDFTQKEFIILPKGTEPRLPVSVYTELLVDIPVDELCNRLYNNTVPLDYFSHEPNY